MSSQSSYAGHDNSDITIPWAPPRRCWAEDPPSFFDWMDVYPFLSHVKTHAGTIKREIDAAQSGSWTPWPETSLYHPEVGQEWKVVPFLHTFPGNDPSRMTWLESSTAAFPFTSSLLRRIPGIRTALFSRMGPNTSLTSHQGWAELSNHVLRCHLAIDIPDDEASRTAGLSNHGLTPGVSGVIVDDDVKWHREGEFLVFDDSHIHSAFNMHPTRARVILIIDIARPAGYAPGISEGGTTTELESFLAHFH